MAAAPSPHDREPHYQRLRDLLDAPVSARWVLVQMAAFLDRIDLRGPEAESYLLPLVEPLAETVEDLDPVGLAPGQVERLAAALRTAQEHQPALRSVDAAGQAEQALRRRAALLYAYAGAVGRATECLHPDGTPVDGETLPASDPRARLTDAQSRTDDEDVEAGLAWVDAHWRREEGGRHATCIPVVERLPAWMQSSGNGLDEDPVGALRRIGVELYGPADATDRLQADVVVQGADEVDVTAVPLTAARRLLDDRHPGLRDRYVQGRLAFDRRHLEHDGRSAGLAIATLFYGAVLDHTHRRTRLRLRSSVAVTGTVSAEGDVQAVEEQALPAKVRTAFFSPTTTLVVPDAQQDAAATARDALLDDFPHGDLRIVGVDRLDALFYDRRLTEQRRIGWVRHTARRLWARRGRVVSGTVIAALLLVIAALVYGPIDKNPVAVEFVGTEMRLKNKGGQVLERVPVGEATVQSAKKGGYNAYRLGDIDRNGQNEVCWAGPKLGRPASQEHFQCKGVGEDTVRWSQEMRFDISFPRKPAITTDQFDANYVRIGDFDASGRPEVILTASHRPYFPSLVVKFDAATGQEQARYLHPGYLNEPPKTADLNEDGVTEILLAGVSNAFNQAVFTVLDPRYVQGHAPTRGNYAVSGMSPAREIVYLRIPPTLVDRAQPRTQNAGHSVKVFDQQNMIQVAVHDGKLPQRSNRASRVLIHLSENFEPVGIGTSSQYDRLAAQLVQEGKIDAIPDYDYFQRYKKQFRYWTGTGWTREPSINARWQAASGMEWLPDSATTEVEGQIVRGSASR